MRRERDTAEYERLLTPEGRAGLPLRRLLMLYLDPFALFMDASLGPAWRRERALCHNRAQRPILLTYIRRWLLIAACSFLGIAWTELLAERAPFLMIPAAGFGIACSVAMTVAACAGAAYFMLGSRAVRNGLR
jgi:hypothetical protein